MNDKTNAKKQKLKSANPIENTIESVPGYPSKLKIFKVNCSRYYWGRVFINGSYKVNSLKTESRKEALEKAIKFYEDALVNSRPEGSRLLKILKSGDVLIFSKLDRAYRCTRNALNELHYLKEKGVTVHSIDLGGELNGGGVGSIIFTILSAFASFERERIASRISEVKQMRKSQGYYVGGRRGFGFNVVDGKKVSNKNEQKLISEMKKKKANGESVLAIHRWLNYEMGVQLNYSSLRLLIK